MHTLVIGAESFIGQSVAKTLRSAGHKVTCSSRKHSSINDNTIFFDLASDIESWPEWPKSVEHAFIAAGMTKQSDCENNKEHAYFINTERTIELVKQLNHIGIHVVYPSTNIVLGCLTPNQPEDTPRSPLGFYAETKAQTEEAIEKMAHTCILRLPKILDGHSGILSHWIDKISQKKNIEAFDDLLISPVSLKYASHAISQILIKKPTGILHISGETEISYFQLAREIRDYMKINIDIILSHMPQDLKVQMPVHPSMECEKIANLLGLKRQNLISMIEDCCNN